MSMFRFGLGFQVGSVSGGPLAISGTPVTTGQDGWVYTSWTAVGARGTPAYTYSNPSATLPTGVTVASGTGIVSGTPTASGVFAGVIRVTDSLAATADLAFSITIAAQSAGYLSEPSRGARTPV